MKQRSTAPVAPPNPETARKIVGIGASAGGLEAFTELLRSLPLNLNAAYILVQHLDPSHRSLLSELLGRTTKLRVHEITNNTQVETNQIYVIPPNSDLTIVRGVLKLSPREKTVGPARSIDNFLTSLAIDQKSNAIAVILSGAGSDGAQGLRAVKAAGGITFAQDEQSAKYDSMPRASVATGCVDFVLPPDKIAKELERLIRTPEMIQSRAAANAKLRRGQKASKARYEKKSQPRSSWPAEPGDVNLRKIFQLLRNKTGLDFTFYKTNTIRRRLTRRLAINKIKGLEAYLKFLRQHPGELDLLHQDLLINVTSFFRNPAVFEQLKKKIFPKLIKGLSPSDTLRIWVAGCSTGQEAYSIAMAYSEFTEQSEARNPIQIFASDVNGAILEYARTGRYTKADVENVSTARQEKFFAREEGYFRVIKSIRDMVIFAQHNLLLDPPFTRVDLISCRNMLIYFESALQQKIIPAFHYALKPNGFLVLGSSESVGQFNNLFTTLEQRHRIYQKKGAPNWPRFDRPPVAPPGRKTLLPMLSEPVEANPMDAQKEADRVVLQRYAPAGVVVNSVGEILQFRGDVGRYLKLPTGKASFHISKIARDGLALALERAFNKAKREKKPVRDKGVCFDSRHGFVNLEIVPLKLKSPCFLILFEEPPQLPRPLPRSVGRKTSTGTETRELSGLKQELAAAREHISSLQEEHDTSVEELQASNEEVQSANEELQSLNEELETSNEELESANEELTTLNEELATRNTELRESEMRLREQATLLEMAPLLARSSKDRIILWSRGAEEMYGFTADEAVGQTAHILLDMKTPEPLQKIQAKLMGDGHWEGEVQHRRKDGTVLSVATQWVVHRDNQKKVRAILEVNTDITARKEAQHALAQSEMFNRTILESSPDCVKVLDTDGRVIFVNPAGVKLLENGDSETRAKIYWPAVWGGETREVAEQAYREALNGKTGRFVAFRTTRKGTPRWWDVVIRPILHAGRNLERLLVVMRDVTEHKNQELAYAERMQLTAVRAEIASQIAADSSMQPLLQRVADVIVSGVNGIVAVRLWLLEDDGRTLSLAANAGLESGLAAAETRLDAETSPVSKVLQRRKAIIVNDVQSDPEKHAMSALPANIQSVAIFPLAVGERIVGVFGAYGKAPLNDLLANELSNSAKNIAQFIQRKQTEQKLLSAQSELSRYNSGLEKLVAERTASLQQAVEQMEEFSYSISHDLRAPARAMEAYASALMEDYGRQLDATGRDYLERIIRSSARMDRMIREILTYSRLSRCQITLRPVTLDGLVREIVEQYPGIHPFSSGIEIAPQLASVMGHEPSLMQAISNLLSNACKFVPPNTKPRCRVWTERNNGHVTLHVKDNGIGIKPEHQHRLFGVFERIHPEGQYEGNGIGLAIVRKAVERMGGQVGVISDGTNGSQFWIRLPAADAQSN